MNTTNAVRSSTKTSYTSTPSPVGTSPSWADARANNGLIRRGQSGQSVRELQQRLADSGVDIEVDGKFGPATERAVRNYQQQRGLKVDGLVGPETTGSLDGTGHHDCHDSGAYAHKHAPTHNEQQARPTGTMRAGDLARADHSRRARRGQEPQAAGNVGLPPAGATERERYDHYASIVRQNGGTVSSTEPTVLGIRGMDRDGRVHDTRSARAYDDMFVVLTPDGRVQEFSGATHAGQNSSRSSPDVAGRDGGRRDGAGDVGMINSGTYRVVPRGNHAGDRAWHVRTSGGSGRLDGVRDTNHDGTFSADERRRSAERGDQLTGVLFHQGGANRPSSIGCQTLSSAGEYRRFIQAVGAGSAFNYTLVDAYRRD